jgi:signal transduction histidine kinase
MTLDAVAAYGRRVSEQVAASPRRPSALDVALTVGLLAFTLVGTHGASSGQEDALRDMDAGGYLLAGLTALTLLARRLYPVGALLTCALAVSSYLAIGYAFGPVLIVMGLMAVSAAAALPLPRVLPAGLLALGIAVAGLAIRFGRDSDESAFVALLAAPAWLAVPFSIGAVIRLTNEGRSRTRRDDAARAADAERLRIAAEVHDVAGHGLAVIAMQAGVALHVLDRKPEQARIALEEIRAASTEALNGLRATLDSLRTADAAPLRPGLPGLADLPALAERISRAGVAVDLRSSGQAYPVFPAVDHAAYRIVQESLTNVLRHANAHRATVTTTWTPGLLTVTVADDGTAGSSGAPGAEGGGIAGMRARAAGVGGSLRAGPGPSGGFEVVATLPLDAR